MKFFLSLVLLCCCMGFLEARTHEEKKIRPRKERFIPRVPAVHPQKKLLLQSHLPINPPSQVVGNRWPDFCIHHLQKDPQGCSSWGENPRIRPQLEFTLYQHMADCYIDPHLVDLLGKKIELIPRSSTICNYLHCPRCKERVVQGYDDYQEDTLLYKCKCTGRYWIGMDDILNDSLEEIVVAWEFCKKPAIHSLYVDWYHQHYFHFLVAQLNYQEQNPSCSCYWRESSEKALKLSDHVYDALDDLLLTSEEIESAFIESFTPYLSDRLPQEFLSGLLFQAFHYSNYMKIFQDMEGFAGENLPKQAAQISDKLHAIRQEIASPLLEIYTYCIERHPQEKIYLERGKIFSDHFHSIEALEDYKKVTLSSEEDLLRLGKLYSENLFYDEAVAIYTKIIATHPQQKEAYFERACAQFEKGNYLAAFADYAKMRTTLSLPPEKDKKFAEGMSLGMQEGREDFTPALLFTPSGLGRGLGENRSLPISKEVVEAAKSVVELIRKKTHYTHLKTLVPELQDYILNWHRIDETIQGYLLGSIIGRYGVDIFSYAGQEQLALRCRNLKKALAHATFEKGTQNPSLQSEIILQAENHRQARRAFLQERVVDGEKQNPPIPDITHSLEEESSYLTLSKESLEKALKKRAGSGQPVRRKMGEIGYAERVHFDQKIGVWVEKKGKKISRKRTDYGIIYYDDVGRYYLLPAAP